MKLESPATKEPPNELEGAEKFKDFSARMSTGIACASGAAFLVAPFGTPVAVIGALAGGTFGFFKTQHVIHSKSKSEADKEHEQ